MHLHPRYSQASGGQGLNYSSLTPLQESWAEPCTWQQVLLVDMCPSGLPTISQLHAAAPSLPLGNHLTLHIQSIKLRVTLFPAPEAGNVTLAWSISAVHLALCLDWGCSQDPSWVNHGQASAKMVGKQQLSFYGVVKLWDYKSGPASSYLVPHEKSLPKTEVTREENRTKRWRETNSIW